MQKYAKLIDGKIEFAPKNKGSISNYNLSVELMTADGYKPLVVIEETTTEKPLVKYRETDKQIEQYAESVPQPEPHIPTQEEKEQTARNERNMKLTFTDWTQLPDAPLTAEMKAAYAEYRQALRDVPEQAGFPDAIEWPEEPTGEITEEETDESEIEEEAEQP